MELWAVKYLLEHSEPAYVFEWLSQDHPEKAYWYPLEELEQSLLDRNDPVINLGLALYGAEHDVREQLYLEGDEIIKRAVLSGPFEKYDIISEKWITGLIPELLAEWNTDNLFALFSNKHLHDDLLVDLFERAAPYDSLDEDKWIILCNMAAQNDRLSTPYDDTYIDGFAYGAYHHVFAAAWQLFDKFPQTNMAAGVLSNLGANLIPEQYSEMDVKRVIEKWNTAPDHKHADSYAWVRTYLAQLLSESKFEALKDSDDLALRKAYYQYLYHPEPEQIKEGYEKDGTDYINAALDNKYIFMREDSREALHHACSDAISKDDALINYYRGRCSYWESQHPEWFKHALSGELPFDQIEDRNERVEKRIEYINAQVNGIHNILHGKQYDPYTEDPEQTITDYLRSELRAIAELLVKIHNKNIAVWGWALAGAAIGYIVGRIF